MHTTNQMLDELASRQTSGSDYRLAKCLHTSQQAISAYRNGRRVFSPHFAARVAGHLNWPIEYVLACVEHERVVRSHAVSESDVANEETHGVDRGLLKAWKNIAAHFQPDKAAQTARPARRVRRAAKVAAMLAVAGISVFGAPPPSSASPGLATDFLYYG